MGAFIMWGAAVVVVALVIALGLVIARAVNKATLQSDRVVCQPPKPLPRPSGFGQFGGGSLL